MEKNEKAAEKFSAEICSTELPKHVGIIMDGNGRWATARGHDRSYGHRKGASIISDVVDHAFSSGVYCLSLYALSVENLQRPADEVKTLLSVLEKGIKKEGERALKNGVRFMISGDKSVLSDKTRSAVEELERESAKKYSRVLNLCFNYGSRQEITRAFQETARAGEVISPENVEKHLYTAELPDVDLVIRTGGEKRLSNFLLWQSSYAELYFCDILWPDFSVGDFDCALQWFGGRKRRFGKV